jgi:hypothetical protein
MAMDREIQTSLHGRKLGLTKDGALVGDGGDGTMRVIADSPTKKADRVVWFDDFLGDILLTPYNVRVGTDTLPPSFLILADQVGGRARILTGNDAGADMASNGVQVDFGSLNFNGSNGNAVFEAMLKSDVITDLALFVGFTDQHAALEMPWTLSGTTFTSNQSDGCGFLFDTAATTDTIRCVAVKTDVDKTSVDTGNAWAAATDIKLRVELIVSPTNAALRDAVFYINNQRVGYIADAVNPATKLTPTICAFSRTVTSRNLDVDYWRAELDR